MPDATMQALAANATQAAAEQASQATSALAQSAALNATNLSGPASDAAAGAGQSLSAAAPAASSAVNATAQSLGAGASHLPDAAAGAATAATGAAHTLTGAAAHAPGVGAAATSGGYMLDSGQSLLGTTLVTAAYLCLILGAIFLAVWLLRRFGPASIAKVKGPDNPQLIGRLMLGPKQSVCVVRVHDRNLVLGVTESRINLLAETDTPAGRCYEEEDDDAFTRFAEELAEKRKDAAGDA